MESVSYYNAIKDSYEALYSEEQLEKIDFALKIVDVDGKSILDVGAGTGLLEERLKGHEVVAVEPSSLADMLISKHIEGVTVVKSTFEDFNFDQKFDVCFCLTVLQDIDKAKRKRFLEKLFSYVKEGGVLVISVLRASGIDLTGLKPSIFGSIGNDIMYIFYKQKVFKGGE